MSNENLIYTSNVPQLSILEENLPLMPIEMTKLVLHKGNVFDELVEAFQQDFYNFSSIEIVLPNGERESAEVFRDAISQFWETFYEKCTVGTNLKVPYLRCGFREKHWQSVSKILVKGWTEEKYFPIKLAPVFMANIFGHPVNDDDIIDNYLHFICESDSDRVKNALENFEDIDLDNLIDVLGNFGARCVPTKENIKQLIKQIAHTELIQKPAFVSKCFQENLNLIRDCDLQKIYGELNPTVKNILSKLHVREEDLTTGNTVIFGYLKKYIKEADTKMRSVFLKFCTGSNITNKTIQIIFITTSGFGTVPIAHRCSGLLELPTTYKNFVNFRNDFNNILNSNIWVIDTT